MGSIALCVVGSPVDIVNPFVRFQEKDSPVERLCHDHGDYLRIVLCGSGGRYLLRSRYPFQGHHLQRQAQPVSAVYRSLDRLRPPVPLFTQTHPEE